jgi:hypothetical protein
MRNMTTPTPERRQGPDRRRLPRGGRRPTDRDGYKDSGARCEAILARLRFAVAPARSADEAVRVMHVLRPNLVVTHLKDETALRRMMDTDPARAGVPMLSLNSHTAEPEALVEEIRRVLRKFDGD